MEFGKRNFVEGRIYAFLEILRDTKREVEAQLAEGEEAQDFEYYFTIIPFEHFSEVLREGFWLEYGEWASNPRVHRLARSIKKSGLKAAPVGNEGNHRAFAMAELGEDLPYFLMIDRKTGEPHNNVYGLRSKVY